MSGDNNHSLSSGSAEETNISGTFIDDYSHLRLSYNRDFDVSFDITDNSQEDLEETKEDVETARRNKLREQWLAQMPDLPHPAITVANIISLASKWMGMVQLKYNNRIEQGTSRPQVEKFSPSRRSTMNCKQLPK